ncbi:hypothetical protein SAMN06309945_2248 [Okibacterium fritillariae]|uniref:3-hydroxyacyl-CoA dehydrogenase n=1 Tax=Okibacterium fritillariae TaxID=123320 RepID=A0A1T5KHM7_9MICO|nr:hypothetical protein SAMN06309945_2248 [Okibacterium fritillariae]
MTPPFPNTPSDSPTATHLTHTTQTTSTTEHDDLRDRSAAGAGAPIRSPARAAATRVPGRSRPSPAQVGLGTEVSAGRSASPLTEHRAPHSPDADPAAAPGAGDRATPEPVLENLALSAIEVIAGARDLEQLGRWVTREVYEHLSIRVTVASRARRVRGAVGKRPVILGTRVSAFHTGDTIVDGVVTVTMRDRTRAVALRIEWVRGRWRASAIHVL